MGGQGIINVLTPGKAVQGVLLGDGAVVVEIRNEAHGHAPIFGIPQLTYHNHRSSLDWLLHHSVNAQFKWVMV